MNRLTEFLRWLKEQADKDVGQTKFLLLPITELVEEFQKEHPNPEGPNPEYKAEK